MKGRGAALASVTSDDEELLPHASSTPRASAPKEAQGRAATFFRKIRPKEPVPPRRSSGEARGAATEAAATTHSGPRALRPLHELHELETSRTRYVPTWTVKSYSLPSFPGHVRGHTSGTFIPEEWGGTRASLPSAFSTFFWHISLQRPPLFSPSRRGCF